jgi:hypothetical protein
VDEFQVEFTDDDGCEWIVEHAEPDGPYIHIKARDTDEEVTYAPGLDPDSALHLADALRCVARAAKRRQKRAAKP